MSSATPSRRAVLGVALALGLGLTGCYRVSPLVGTGSQAGSSATPLPITDERRAGVATETSLAELARASGLAGIAAAHTAHATALAQADPLAGRNADTTAVISPTAAPTSGNLIAAERAAGNHYRTVATAASDPAMALLWASLSVFCSNVSTTGPAPRTGDVYPTALPTEPLPSAQQVLLSRLNALVTGLEWGIGQLASSDPLRSQGQQRLQEVNTERSALREELRAASASPTPLLPGYPMPATPSTSASTKTLWVGLELGVLAGCGRVVAASSGARRSTAITAMSTPLAHAMALGSAVPGWPGWV